MVQRARGARQEVGEGKVVRRAEQSKQEKRPEAGPMHAKDTAGDLICESKNTRFNVRGTPRRKD